MKSLLFKMLFLNLPFAKDIDRPEERVFSPLEVVKLNAAFEIIVKILLPLNKQNFLKTNFGTTTPLSRMELCQTVAFKGLKALVSVLAGLLPQFSSAEYLLSMPAHPQLSWEVGAVCLWHPRAQNPASLEFLSVPPCSCQAHVGVVLFAQAPISPPFSNLHGWVGGERKAGVMFWGLRVATRQATERSGVQGLGRTDELPGGLTSAREKGALSSVVAVFIYTHTHARARYVFLNVAHSQGTIGCPVCTA